LKMKYFASIILPMYNSARTIGETLDGLEKQNRSDFEIIVIDDGSKDDSVSIVEDFKRRSRLPVTILKQANAGPARARNNGVTHTDSEIVIFLDSDCIPHENLVEVLAGSLNREKKVAACSCVFKGMDKVNIAARYIDLEITRRQEKLIGRYVDAIATMAAAYYKDVFEELGGFDTSFRRASGEDYDFAYKVQKAGYKIFFTDQTWVHHYHVDTLKKYLKQQYTRGYWMVPLFLKNREKIVRGDSYSGHEAQVQFILSCLALLSIPLAFWKPYALAIGFGLLLLSNLTLGVWAFKRDQRFLLLAPVIASLRSLAGTIGVFRSTLDIIGGIAWRSSRN